MFAPTATQGFGQIATAPAPPRNFRDIVGDKAWMALPYEVRARFERHLRAQDSLIYQGRVVETRMNGFGRALAILLIPFGAPLPLRPEVGGEAAIVTVTEDSQDHGQFWTRLYGGRKNLPQVIQSSKRFAGPTGLEERLGHGLGRMIGLSLTLEAEEDALHFICERFFLYFFGFRLFLPAWLNPGRMVVSHRANGPHRFIFSLSLTHKWLGEMIAQTCEFHDMMEV